MRKEKLGGGRATSYAHPPAISLAFSLSQHLRDTELLDRLAILLDCGIVRRSSNRDAAELIITKSEDLNKKLILAYLRRRLRYARPSLRRRLRGKAARPVIKKNIIYRVARCACNLRPEICRRNKIIRFF
jgi:hypothetical protein